MERIILFTPENGKPRMFHTLFLKEMKLMISHCAHILTIICHRREDDMRHWSKFPSFAPLQV